MQFFFTIYAIFIIIQNMLRFAQFFGQNLIAETVK